MSYRNHLLSEKEEQNNHKISKIRVRVEHIFGRMSQMGAEYCRSIGLNNTTPWQTSPIIWIAMPSS